MIVNLDSVPWRRGERRDLVEISTGQFKYGAVEFFHSDRVDM